MSLKQPIHHIKGIGQATEATLALLNITTIQDLIEHYPYRYELNELSHLEQVKHGDTVTVEGTIQSLPNVRYYGGKRTKLSVRLLVKRILITLVLFNRAFLRNRLTPGTIVTVTGKWDQHRLTITVDKIELSPFSSAKAIEAIYSLKEGVYQRQFRNFIQEALTTYASQMEELLPEQLRREYKLYTKKEALHAIHFPKSPRDLKQARRRLVYEELLLFQLKMQAFRKFDREKSQGVRKTFPEQKLLALQHALPFQLTKSQQRVLQEIISDLTSIHQMNRLLQGDVGSGKTVVAALALYANGLAGFQGALMVPTEILAEQHVQSIRKLLGTTDLTVELLTSSIKGKKRKALLKALETGEIDIVIGTHSLIQAEVNFSRLGLVITDEQHRFGVNQRRILKQKGLHPDVLFMTATPIPRTLAITAFGDMDVSTIDELPAGRKKIETYWVKNQLLERVYQFIYKEVMKGRQAYVICPLIEESDKLDVQNAIDVYSELVQKFPQLSIALLHGRLTNEEKETVMRNFSENKAQIVVSTTVVEVGVNVPNATVMVIIDAERFGLAQLHQLRGRVGRGAYQSYCILIADPKSEDGKERMRVMTETNDGFLLSEKDLEIRGPGDFFGYKQSGIPDFKIADLVHDYRALEVATNDAKQFIHSETFWTSDEFAALRNLIMSEQIMSGEKLD